jgi:hypothetical protein
MNKQFLIVVSALLLLTSCGGDKTQTVNKELPSKEKNTSKADSLNSKIEEEPISKKKELLQNAIGEYQLTAISGAMGANTMFDTEKVKNKWVSTSSSINEAMRESYDIELNKSDIKLLNSLKIEVDQDLNVTFRAGNKVIVESKFIDNGMDYKVKAKGSFNERLQNLSPSTVLDGDNLMILANDHIDYSTILTGSFDVITSDNMTLYYNVKEKCFYLEIFLGECCDANTFKFEQ